MMTINEAMKLFEEGKKARTEMSTDMPYEKNSSEAFWWAKGWLEKHKERQ